LPFKELNRVNKYHETYVILNLRKVIINRFGPKYFVFQSAIQKYNDSNIQN
jgi:hypothetical protein